MAGLSEEEKSTVLQKIDAAVAMRMMTTLMSQLSAEDQAALKETQMGTPEELSGFLQNRIAPEVIKKALVESTEKVLHDFLERM
mgnify:CR=1 FL=1